MKIEMEDRAALSTATRMIGDIENTEGYVAGKTPVVLYGVLGESEHTRSVIYLKDIEIHGNYNIPFNYDYSYPFYLSYYLAADINLSTEPVDPAIVESMPTYPEKGSIQLAGDVLVVKLSDSE